MIMKIRKKNILKILIYFLIRVQHYFFCRFTVSATQDLPSARAFLFSLNNNNGDAPIKIALKQDQRGQAIRNLVGAGPSFGTRDLVFRSMRSIQSSLGTTYELPENGAADFLVGEPEFQADDVEVLYAGGTFYN